MIDESVVFFDSGIGGLPYLEWLRSRRPGLDLVYLADNQGFPYGESPPEAAKRDILDAVRCLFSLGRPRLLVLACNTASVLALDEIRAAAPCPVVGTVPAIKPAALLAPPGPIAVMATEGTVNSNYLDGLVLAFAPGRPLEKIAAGDIVRYVEESFLDDDGAGTAAVLAPALERIKEAGVTSVVLGCTHFLHVMNDISAALGSGVRVVDSLEGVGQRILEILGDDGSGSAGTGTFLVTDPRRRVPLYKRFARRYGLNWGGAC